MAQRPPLSLKARALALVAQREHSPLELRRKLLAQFKRERALTQRRALARKPGQTGALPAASAPNRADADVEAHEGVDEDVDTDTHTDTGRGDEGLAGVQRQLDELLAWLLAEGLLSAERFVESRVHVRAPRHGKRRILQELARHGMTLDAETAATLERSETARAQAVWLKRFGQLAPDSAGRAKQMRFLCARGFGADLAHRIVTGRD